MGNPELQTTIEVRPSSLSLGRWWLEATEEVDRAPLGSIRIEVPDNVLEGLGGRVFSVFNHSLREEQRREIGMTRVPLFGFEDLKVGNDSMAGRIKMFPVLSKLGLAPTAEFSASNDSGKPGNLAFRFKGRGLMWSMIDGTKIIMSAARASEKYGTIFNDRVAKMLLGDGLGVEISSWRLDRGRLIIDGEKIPDSQLYLRYFAPLAAKMRLIGGEEVGESELQPRVEDGRVLEWFDRNDIPTESQIEEEVAVTNYEFLEHALMRRMQRRIEKVLGVKQKDLRGDKHLLSRLNREGRINWRDFFDSTVKYLIHDEGSRVILGEAETPDFLSGSFAARSEFMEILSLLKGTRFDVSGMEEDDFAKALSYGDPDHFDFDPKSGREEFKLGISGLIDKARRIYEGEMVSDENHLDVFRDDYSRLIGNLSAIDRTRIVSRLERLLLDERSILWVNLDLIPTLVRDLEFSWVPENERRGSFELIERMLAESGEAVKAEGLAEEERGLTFTENKAVLFLADIAGFEGSASLSRDELRDAFDRMARVFGLLPFDSKMRREILDDAFGQLGGEAEKLRRSGKADWEIFEEWLKRVFIPLYRRAEKIK